MSDREENGESRRQIARRAMREAGERSTRLAQALMKLPASAVGKLDLDEELREKLVRARAVSAHIARRRAERTLAGELRRVDLDDLEGRLESLQTSGAADRQKFHLAEEWRTRMIEGGIAAAADFPGGTAEPLPRLIEQARRERTTGRPPGAARALFRHIAAILNRPSADQAQPIDHDDGDASDDGDQE